MANNSYWQTKITDFNGGLSPAWWESKAPSYGNKNMASDMKDISIISPHSLSQGLGYTEIDDTLSNNITSVIGRLVSSDTTYGGGGDTIYEITSSSVTDIHTISGTDPVIEDVVDYNGTLYYSYNDDGDGYIGTYDYDSTWDDTWEGPFSDNPHPLLVAGDNKIYMGTGAFVADYEEGGSLDAAALDIMSDDIVVDLEWSSNRVYIAANSPEIDGGTNNGSIFIWDGASVSWENEITVKGRIKSIYSRDGIVYVFYETGDGTSTIGYIDGGVVKPVIPFEGSLPTSNQITKYKGFLMWLSDDTVYAYGARSPQLENALSKIATNKHSIPGFLSTPFTEPMTSSTDGTDVSFGSFNGVSNNGYWKSLMFSISSTDRRGHLQFLKVTFSDITDKSFEVKILSPSGEEKNSFTIDENHSDTINSATVDPNINDEESIIIKIDFSNSNNSESIDIYSIKLVGKTGK